MKLHKSSLTTQAVLCNILSEPGGGAGGMGEGIDGQYDINSSCSSHGALTYVLATVIERRAYGARGSEERAQCSRTF